jgi:hypothetical protein
VAQTQGAQESGDDGPRNHPQDQLTAKVEAALAALIGLADTLDELDLEDVEPASGPPCWP